MGIFKCIGVGNKIVLAEVGGGRTARLRRTQCARFGIIFDDVKVEHYFRIALSRNSVVESATHLGATMEHDDQAVEETEATYVKYRLREELAYNVKTHNDDDGQLARLRHVQPAVDIPPAQVGGGANQNRHNESQPADGFVNPYNFAPIFCANNAANGLGHYAPLGHNAFTPETFRGQIVLTLDTQTPLLSQELCSEAADGLPVYGTKTDGQGNARISGASIKGVVRSLFEQVTGSRLGEFSNKKVLSHRVSTEIAKSLMSAVVLSHNADDHKLVLGVCGTLYADTAALRPHGPAPDLLSTVGVPEESGFKRFKDGAEVYCWVQLFDHGNYCMWRTISELIPDQGQDTPVPVPPKTTAGFTGTPVLVKGRLHITGETATNKHDERLAVTATFSATNFPVPDMQHMEPIIVEGIAYAQVMNRLEMTLDSFSGKSPDGVSSAPYAEEPGKSSYKELSEGRTLFIEPLPEGRLTSKNVVLHPGLITRKMFGISPWDLLPAESRPANSMEEFSPADRVFGWVKEGRGSSAELPAYKGHLNFSEPTLTAGCSNVIESHNGKTWKLATLNGPKPAQVRFYTRKADGSPMSNVSPDSGYQPGHKLAGHKVYVHHKVPAEYWSLPPKGWNGGASREVPGGRFQNFLAAAESPASTHMAIKDWIKIGATFECTVTFDNLNRMELAALLWCCQLPRNGVWRMGKGKPLGFGSVRVDVDTENTQIYTQEQVKDFFQNPFSAAPTQSSADTQTTIDELIKQFDSWFEQTAPATRNAVIGAAVGTSLPVHYPRLRSKQAQNREYVPLDGYSYEWFGVNERVSAQQGHGMKKALPLATINANTWTLPYKPHHPPQH